MGFPKFTPGKAMLASVGGVIFYAVFDLYHVGYVKNAPVNTMATAAIDLQSDSKGLLAVYWARPGDSYRERGDHMKVIRAASGRKRYELRVPGLDKLRRLRIDPPVQADEGEIRGVRIVDLRGNRWQLLDGDGIGRLHAVNNIEVVAASETGVRFRTNGEDPQFEIDMDPRFWRAEYLLDVSRGALSGLIISGLVVFLIYASVNSISWRGSYAPASRDRTILLLIVFILPFVIIVVAGFLAQTRGGFLRLIIREDGIVEYSQAVLFAVSSVLSGTLARRFARESKWFWVSIYGVAAAGLVFVAGEEISWGKG